VLKSRPPGGLKIGPPGGLNIGPLAADWYKLRRMGKPGGPNLRLPGGLDLSTEIPPAGHVFIVHALAAWQWYNYVTSRAPPGKEILRLSLDEASVCLFQDSGRGNVFVSRKRRVTQFLGS